MNTKLNNKSSVIKELYKNNKFKYILIKLFTQILGKIISYKKIMNTLNKNVMKTDKEIFNAFLDILADIEIVIPYADDHDKKRAKYKWNLIKQYVDIKPNRILDFGGNVGNIGYHIGKMSNNLDKENIIIVDKKVWESNEIVPRNDITFIEYEHMNKIKSNSVELIIINHVLHHIPDTEFKNIITNLERILNKKTGYVLLVEHNCDNQLLYNLIDLEHAIYDIMVRRIVGYNTYIKNSYSNYKKKNDWIKLFSNFKILYNNQNKNSLDNTFNMILQIDNK